MSFLKIGGLVGGGTVGVLVLGMLVFTQMGEHGYATLLGGGLLLFILAGAAALIAKAGLLR